MKELAKFLKDRADQLQGEPWSNDQYMRAHIEQLRIWATEVETLETPILQSAVNASDQMVHYLSTNTILSGVPTEMIREWRRALHNAYTEGYVQRGLDEARS